MHGTGDAGISYSNGVRSVQSWVKLDGCPSTAQVTENYKGAAKAKLEVYGPCEGNTEVDMLSIEGLAHVWLTKSNAGVSATEEGWNFMKKYSTASTGTAGFADANNLRPHPISVRYAGRTIIGHIAEHATGVRLFDTKGRTIGAWNKVTGHYALPVRSIPGGIYLLSVERPDGNVLLRLSVL
jgi:hypothetical protein